MTRKLWLLTGIFMVLQLALSAAPVRAQEKSYVAERFDVAISVEEGGSLLVTETVVYDFSGGPFTFIFRELPTDHTDGITIVESTVDGRHFPRGENAGQVEIAGRDPIRLKWHLEPTLNARRTVVLTYRAAGVVRQGEHGDEVRWQALPDEYEFPIGSSRTTVRWPAGVEPLGAPVVLAGEAAVIPAGDHLRFEANNLAPDTPFVFSLSFPGGSLISTPPAWQLKEATQAARAPIWIAAGVFVVFGAIIAVTLQMRQISPRGNTPSSPLYEAPTDIPPGLAGAIVTTSAGASWATALGALFDLAEQGVLEIVESPEKKWYRRHDFLIRLLAERHDLPPHQVALVTLLFGDGAASGKTVKFSELGKVVTSRRWSAYTKAVRAELKAGGWYSETRQRARTYLVVAGVAVILLGTATIAVPATGQAGPAFLVFTMGIIGAGLTAVIAGSTLTPLSDIGAAQAAEWKRFAAYLKRITRGRETVVGAHTFVKYLPFAAAFGLLPRWARRFRKEGVEELPAYFHALPDSNPADSMAAFVAMSAASGSAGGSAAGAAGAGAAGGGAAGAG